MKGLRAVDSPMTADCHVRTAVVGLSTGFSFSVDRPSPCVDRNAKRALAGRRHPTKSNSAPGRRPPHIPVTTADQALLRLPDGSESLWRHVGILEAPARRWVGDLVRVHVEGGEWAGTLVPSLRRQKREDWA